MKVAVFQFRLFGINTYVVHDPETRDCMIVDPGMSCKEENNAIIDYIKLNNLRLKGILNTHLHIDHVAGNEFIKSRFQTQSMANKEDRKLGNMIEQQAVMFGLGKNFKNIETDVYLSDGDVVEIGHGSLKVLAVPGHSQGSIAFYDRRDGFVITGDALFQGSIGRTDLPGGDFGTLLNSIKSKLLSLPDDTVVYPGHGNPTTIGNEKKSNPYLNDRL